jgi:hypothetical protein
MGSEDVPVGSKGRQSSFITRENLLAKTYGFWKLEVR